MRQTVYYGIIGLGILWGAVLLVRWLWFGDRLAPPSVLADRILNAPSAEEKISAAHDMVRHGPVARAEMDRVLATFRTDDPAVAVAVFDAAAAAKCWRSLPKLFDWMEHPDARIRGKAGSAVSVIMGADYFFRASDPPEKRAETLARIKMVYQRLQPELEAIFERGAAAGAEGASR
mgnify:CR=1 FL=1